MTGALTRNGAFSTGHTVPAQRRGSTGGGRALRDKLASRMFLLLHDPFTGKALARATTVRRAVMGAELAELISDRRITTENDRIVLAADRHLADPISGFVLGRIAEQTETHVVAVWAAALAGRVHEMVSAALVTDEIVAHLPGPRLLPGADRYPAVDLLAAAGPRLAVEHALRTPEERDQESALLAALVSAIGAARTLNTHVDRATTRAAVAECVDALPTDLRDLVIGLEVAQASGELPRGLRLHQED